MGDTSGSDARIFKCDKCDKEYSRRDYLERHALNHEKPNIICDLCGKTFQRQDVLRKHLREACKGKREEVPDSSGRKRQRTSETPTLVPSISYNHPVTNTLSSLQSTLAPALDYENATTPNAQLQEVDRVLPARAESALGIRNPISVSGTWGSAATMGDSMDDLFGWLFNQELSDTDNPPVETASSVPITSAFNPMPAAFPPVAPLELTNRSIAPSQSHHFSVRNSPLQPRRIPPSASTIPPEWRLPPARQVITDEARMKILDMYEAPLRDEIESTFSLGRMTLFLELYFLHFSPLYPIIHRASLGYRTLSPDLLLTMICIGTAFTADGSCLDLSTRLVKRIRDRIFERVEEDPRLDISNLQTLLQLNYFSRSYCSLKQHDISQIFHSPSMTLARLSGVFIPNFLAERQPMSSDPLQRWLDWVAVEERTRLGWFAFMMDTENAALFRHYLLIHCYVIEIPFPDAPSAWTARDPPAWQNALQSTINLPTFRTALRDLAGRGTITFHANHELRWILLHGLISVSWTLLWRDLGDLSMVGDSKITQWKESLKRAFTAWTEHEEAQTPAPMDAAIHQAGITFGYLGMILLVTETESIRVFAGASSVAARPISPGEWFAANAYVNSWAKSQDATYAVTVAMKALRKIFTDIDESLYRTTPSMIPWCTYISAIVIWAYASAVEGQDTLIAPYVTTSMEGRQQKVDIEPSLARRDALSYLDTHLQTAIPGQEAPKKNRCAGIIAYAAHLVGTLPRGNIEESRTVLNGLLAEHL